ncbi:MAG: hypothetical protein OHK0013_39990 [Sandaracinaceae bacterium]
MPPASGMGMGCGSPHASSAAKDTRKKPRRASRTEKRYDMRGWSHDPLPRAKGEPAGSSGLGSPWASCSLGVWRATPSQASTRTSRRRPGDAEGGQTAGPTPGDGVPLERWDEEALHRRIGFIFQDFIQYQLTVVENIGAGDVRAFEDEA